MIRPAQEEPHPTGAQNGWITAMSAYRWEDVTLTATGVTSPPSHYDATKIESCLGEVTDVLRLTNLVLTTVPHADPNRVLMWGWSHGGCVTWRAVEQGAPVQAAATFAAMNDVEALAELYISKSQTVPIQQWGYTPTTAPPNLYSWREPVNFGADLNARTDVRMLMLQGGENVTEPLNVDYNRYADGVLEPGVACELANLLSPASTNLWLNHNTGIAMTGPPTDCLAGYSILSLPASWAASATNPYAWGTSWPPRVLAEIDGLDHESIIKNTESFMLFPEFVKSLGWGPAPYPNVYNFLGN